MGTTHGTTIMILQHAITRALRRDAVMKKQVGRVSRSRWRYNAQQYAAIVKKNEEQGIPRIARTQEADDRAFVRAARARCGPPGRPKKVTLPTLKDCAAIDEC